MTLHSTLPTSPHCTRCGAPMTPGGPSWPNDWSCMPCETGDLVGGEYDGLCHCSDPTGDDGTRCLECGWIAVVR